MILTDGKVKISNSNTQIKSSDIILGINYIETDDQFSVGDKVLLYSLQYDSYTFIKSKFVNSLHAEFKFIFESKYLTLFKMFLTQTVTFYWKQL